MRIDKRFNNQIRNCKITTNYIKYPEGSVLIEMGETKVICNVTIDEHVPSFQKEISQGWLTAEYSMLPRATETRTRREVNAGKQSQRGVEIQRLIARVLRSAIDLSLIPDYRITLDCDVIQADGGTRTACITGGFVAIYLACNRLLQENKIKQNPIKRFVAGISVGIVNSEILLDLSYKEDSMALVDMNVAMTDKNEFVEIQGTGENYVFNTNDLNKMIELAQKGIFELISIQKEALNLTY